jgi:hypothetical protein
LQSALLSQSFFFSSCLSCFAALLVVFSSSFCKTSTRERMTTECPLACCCIEFESNFGQAVLFLFSVFHFNHCLLLWLHITTSPRLSSHPHDVLQVSLCVRRNCYLASLTHSHHFVKLPGFVYDILFLMNKIYCANGDAGSMLMMLIDNFFLVCRTS